MTETVKNLLQEINDDPFGTLEDIIVVTSNHVDELAFNANAFELETYFSEVAMLLPHVVHLYYKRYYNVDLSNYRFLNGNHVRFICTFYVEERIVEEEKTTAIIAFLEEVGNCVAPDKVIHLLPYFKSGNKTN